MKNAISEGQTIDHAPAAARAAGAATLIGAVGNGMLGVAVTDVGAGVSGVFRIKGVFELPKLTADVVAQGALLYWDNTNLRLTLTSASNTLAGRAFEAASGTVSVVKIAINVP
jgi:predicted RecA/RadA family phage recombinase